MIEWNDCVVGGPVSKLAPVLGTVAEAMPRLADDGGAVRAEQYLCALRVVARCDQDVVLVRFPSISARGAMVVGLAELTHGLEGPASGQLTDQFVLTAVDGRATLTVGESEHELTPVALSAVETVVTSFPEVGTVAGAELLAVAEYARASGAERGVTVHVGNGDILFSPIGVGEVPVAEVEVREGRQLVGEIVELHLGAARVAALARRLGDGPIRVRFTWVHDGAFVALVSDDGLVEAQLHATPVGV